MKGVIVNRACALPSHQHTSSQTKGFNQLLIDNWEHTRTSRLSASTHKHTVEVAAAVLRTDQRNDLAKLVVNATTTPDSATILRKPMKPRPSLRACLFGLWLAGCAEKAAV
jgi:hypothetical protein